MSEEVTPLTLKEETHTWNIFLTFRTCQGHKSQCTKLPPGERKTCLTQMHWQFCSREVIFFRKVQNGCIFFKVFYQKKKKKFLLFMLSG